MDGRLLPDEAAKVNLFTQPCNTQIVTGSVNCGQTRGNNILTHYG